MKWWGGAVHAMLESPKEREVRNKYEKKSIDTIVSVCHDGHGIDRLRGRRRHIG